MPTDLPLQPASVSRALALAKFPRHAPHQPVGFHVEAPGPEQSEATVRLRWHGEDDSVETDRLSAVLAYLTWSGRPARIDLDDRGPFVLVIAHQHATQADLTLPAPKISADAARYEMVAGDRQMATGMSAEVVTDLVQDARRAATAVYQLPDGEIRIGHTRLIPESDTKA